MTTLDAGRYWRLSAFYFAYLGALGAYSPYFAPYLDARGLSAMQISTMMSLWYGTRVFAPGLWSFFAARSAQPLRWLQAGAIGTLACFALFLLPMPYWALLLVMTAFASCYNAIMPQFEAHTLAQLGAARAAYGRIRVWGSVGFVLANVGFGVLLQQIGYGHLILVLLPCFAALVWAAYAAPPASGASPSAAASTEELDAGFLPTLRRTEVQRFLLAAFLMQVAHGPFYVFYSLFLKEHGYPATAIGGLWAVGVLVEIGVFLVIRGWLQRYPAEALMGLCFMVGALRWSLTAAFPESPAMMVLAQCGHAFTFAVFHSAGMQLVAQYFPGRLAGHGQGVLYGFSSGFGGVVGALAAGAAWHHGGGVASFAMAALISLLGAVLLLVRLRVRT